MTRTVLALLLILSLGFALTATTSAASSQPNILFIVADDLGWVDLGCYGSDYHETPALDKLRAQGMMFTDAYSNGPNCAPSRACFMSGQYGPRHGVYTVGSARRFDGSRWSLDYDQRKLLAVENGTIDDNEILWSEVLGDNGYATGMFGKWGLGRPGPRERGFPTAIDSANTHFNFTTIPLHDVPEGTYVGDFMTDHAVQFLEEHTAGPFFLYMPYYLVHSPWEAPDDLIAKYKNKSPGKFQQDPVYAAMVDRLDSNIGRLMQTLDKLRLAENTLVLFTSDNGGFVGGDKGIHDEPTRPTSNLPLRGGKGMLYEGGIRVPLLARWPGHIAPGSTSREPVAGIDFYPTFLEATGVAPPEDYTLDGMSLLPLLSGEKDSLNREALYWHFPGYLPSRQRPATVVRSGDWKLLHFHEDDRHELYDVRQDLGERMDLAARMPEKVKTLARVMQDWIASTEAPLPKRNPNWDPANEGRN